MNKRNRPGWLDTRDLKRFTASTAASAGQSTYARGNFFSISGEQENTDPDPYAKRKRIGLANCPNMCIFMQLLYIFVLGVQAAPRGGSEQGLHPGLYGCARVHARHGGIP